MRPVHFIAAADPCVRLREFGPNVVDMTIRPRRRTVRALAHIAWKRKKPSADIAACQRLSRRPACPLPNSILHRCPRRSAEGKAPSPECGATAWQFIWRGVPVGAAKRGTLMENTRQDFGRTDGRRASCGASPRNDLAAEQAGCYAFLQAIFMAVPAAASGSRRIPWYRGRASRECLPRRQKAARVPACPTDPAIRGREADFRLCRCRRRPP